MKRILALVMLATCGTVSSSVVVGTPSIPSMDPFCAS